MRKLILTTTCAGALVLGMTSVRAADPEPLVSEVDWSGLYLGAHAGVISSEFDHSILVAPTFDTSSSDNGFIGGGLVGYNFQVDNLVLGIEGDISFLDLNGSAPNPASTNDYDIDMTYSVRGRLGYAMDNYLLFATAGATWADINVDDTGFICTQSGSGTAKGYQLGGGGEWRASDSISLRAEYLYSNYGDKGITLGAVGGCTGPQATTSDLETHTVRVAVTWTFSDLFGGQ